MGSDESLGGALLTPIPWLEGVDAESAARNGVSQGELLRKEQELNIVPANQVEAQGRAGSDASEGPPEIGAQDVGPQPEGTVFPDPPRSEEEIELKKDGGEENEEEKKEGKTEKESDRGEEKQEEKEEEAKKDDAADADGDMVMDEKADDKAVVKEAEQSKADGEKDVDMDAPAEMEVEAAGGGDKAKDEDAMKE